MTRSDQREETTAMAELHRVSVSCTRATVDVVFVHGLDGHWQRTWLANASPEGKASALVEAFWPQWIASAFPLFSVWSLEYEASVTGWWAGMSLGEHGEQALACLTSYGIGDRPIVFVAHSLGGLVVKSLLRSSYESAEPAISNAAHAFGDFGQHQEGAPIDYGTGYVALHLCIELAAALTRELPSQ
jgi:hypothetical protein